MHTAVLQESCAKGESIFFRGIVLGRLPMPIDGSDYSRAHMAALTGLRGLGKKSSSLEEDVQGAPRKVEEGGVDMI